MREYPTLCTSSPTGWVVDDTRFRDAFGDHTTPLDDALATTLEWYRRGAAPGARVDAPPADASVSNDERTNP
jgi:hypothetical protein